VDGDERTLSLLEHLRLLGSGTRLLAEDGTFMRECMSVALNTIGASIPRMEARPILSLG
jgi:hypothetical protein